MIRFILLRSFQDNMSGARWTAHETLDAEVPELEALLKSGGRGPDGHDGRVLVGVELDPLCAISAQSPSKDTEQSNAPPQVLSGCAVRAAIQQMDAEPASAAPSETPRYIDAQTGETMPQLLRRTGKAPYPYPEVNEIAAAYVEKIEREVNALRAQIKLMDSKLTNAAPQGGLANAGDHDSGGSDDASVMGAAPASAAPSETPRMQAAWEEMAKSAAYPGDAQPVMDEGCKLERELALALDHIEKDDKEIERLNALDGALASSPDRRSDK